MPPSSAETTGENHVSGHAGAIFQAQQVTGDVHVTTAPAAPSAGPPVPHELPPVPPRFTNRTSELAELRRGRTEGAQVLVLSGIGGIGKTSLAAQWAHEIAGDYPDGQIHLQLGGGRGEPVVPADVLGTVLRSLGADPRYLPRTVEDRAALLRTLTHGRRVLVLADDAVGEAQVRPLIPASPGCTLIVTARSRLIGLLPHGAVFVDVDPLPEAEAAELLGRLLNRAADAVPQLPAFAAAAAGVPLALCAIAGALSLDPGHTPDSARALLARTDPLTLEDSVDNALNAAVAALPDAARRLHLLCALHPGRHLPLGAAAALAGTGEEDTREALQMMTAMSLTRPTAPQVWTLYDVVQEHARTRAEEEIPEEDRETALDRLFEHYLIAAAAADITLNRTRLRYATAFDRAASDLFDDRKAALQWWDSEGETVAALVRLAHTTHRHTPAWELVDACKAWFVTRRPYETWRELTDLALSSASIISHHRAQAGMLLSKAQGAMCSQDFGLAEELAGTAGAIAERAGDRRSYASSLEVRARALDAAGRLEEAAPFHKKAIRLAEEYGSPRSIALKKRFYGEHKNLRGLQSGALALLDQALEVFRQADDDYQITQVLLGRVGALLEVGRVDDAAAAAAEAAEIAAATDAVFQQGAAAEAMASVETVRGDGPARRRNLETALERYHSLGAPEAQRVRALLQDMDQDSGD